MAKRKRMTQKRSVPEKKQVTTKRTKIVQEVPCTSSSKKKTRIRRATSKMYWTDETEQAVITYNATTDPELRERIYRDQLAFPLHKLVENVFNRFGFTYFRTESKKVQEEALAHLVANLGKFDPNRSSKLHKKKKSKAFAYFSVIAKNWFILLNNNNYKEFQTHIPISEERGEDTVQLQSIDKHHAQAETNEFMKLTLDFWETNVTKIFSKHRDLEIAYAVMELLRSAQRIDAFNKKALYLYIRDMSDCKTQQITKVINKMKQYHRTIYRSYLNEGTISTAALHLS